MLEFYQQKSLRSYLRSPLALILLGILCLLMARIVYARYTIEREMAARQLESESEFQALIERKKQLEEKVKYLSNDRGIEAEMRRNFDVAREGEKVVIILDKKEEEHKIEPLTKSAPAESKWYQFWR